MIFGLYCFLLYLLVILVVFACCISYCVVILLLLYWLLCCMLLLYFVYVVCSCIPPTRKNGYADCWRLKLSINQSIVTRRLLTRLLLVLTFYEQLLTFFQEESQAKRVKGKAIVHWMNLLRNSRFVNQPIIHWLWEKLEP